MSTILMGAIAAAVVSAAQIDKMYDECVFMRSVRFSNPAHPQAHDMFEECSAHLSPEDKFQARKEWHERWLEQVRRDKLLGEQIQREEENKNIRWSGCTPVRVTDKFGNIDFEKSKKLARMLCS